MLEVMTRSRIGTALCTGIAGVVAVTGLTGCDRLPGADSSAAAVSADAPAEAQALTLIGFDTGTQGLDAAPSPSGSATPKADRAGRRAARPLRRYLRRDVLHGEFVVDTRKNGPQTVDVQRGTVTAVNATTVTLKSTDGYTLTWTLGSPVRVIRDKAAASTDAVKTGEQIGVAGTRKGTTTTAALIVIV